VRLKTIIGNNHDHERVVTNFWQFIYLLAPARDWGGFDRLDVTCFLPAGWKAASNIDLQRDGDVLRGTFAGIPHDALELTIQMPPEPFIERIQLIENSTWIGIGVLVPVLLILTWKYGGRIRERVGLSLFLLGSAAIWGGAGAIAGWLLIYVHLELPFVPALQRPSYGWAFPCSCFVIFITMLSAIIGGTIAVCLYSTPDDEKTISQTLSAKSEHTLRKRKESQ
jgi:hypothetical protein